MPLHRIKTSLGSLALGIISIAWILVVGYGLIALARENIAREEQKFLDDIDDLVIQLKYKLDANEAVLAGFVSFLQAVDKSDHEATERYAASTIIAYPHIYMMEVARKLPVSEQAAFESSMQNEGRADFVLKDFSAITGQPSVPAGNASQTWPIVFTYPSRDGAQAIPGLRLETVTNLSRCLETAQSTQGPVASPVFELHEKGNAYLLLQEAIRPNPRNPATTIDCFGNAMVAILVIRGDSLALNELKTPAFRYTRLSAHLDAPEKGGTPIFEHAAAEAGRMDKLLLPAFRRQVRLGSQSQPVALVVDRQLRWSDLLNHGFMTKGFLLLLVLAAILWLITRHRIMLGRLALEHERIAYLATHDALTGLPNRVLFADRFNQAFHHWKRNGSAFALFLIDLDRFKEINDTHGHEIGDQVLLTTAMRISNELRSGDTVSRYGGDEYYGLLTGIFSPEDARKVGEKLLHAISRPMTTNIGALTVSCSIGIAICPQHGQTLDELKKLADQAMYQAKEKGRNAVSVFSFRHETMA